MGRKKPDLSKFTPQQLQAAEMLADLEAKPQNKDVANAVGISERQLYRWLTDEDFIALVNYRSETAMDLFGVDVYRALLSKVRKGDVKAIELAMKRMGVLKEIRETTSSVNVEVKALAGKTTEELLAELAIKEAILLDTSESSPDVYEVDEDEAFIDALTAGRYTRDEGDDAAD